MAFSVMGFLGRVLRPNYSVLRLRAPETEIQIRHFAARKCTREKALKKKIEFNRKRAAKLANEQAVKKKLKVSGPQLEPTIDCVKPEPPTDQDVFVCNLYKYKDYTLPEALKCLREYFHPTVFNDPNSKVHVLIELNMTTNTKKGIEKWKNVLILPHAFSSGVGNKILVFCDESLVPEMLAQGADFAGGIALMKKIKDDGFSLRTINRVISDVKFSDEVMTLRSKLKLLTPRMATGTLTTDLKATLQKFKFGTEYTCHRNVLLKHFGWIEVDVATLNMSDAQVEENFMCLLKDVLERRQNKKELDFIQWIWVSCPNWNERFKIDVQHYVDRINEAAKEHENETVEDLDRSEPENEKLRVAT